MENENRHRQPKPPTPEEPITPITKDRFMFDLFSKRRSFENVIKEALGEIHAIDDTISQVDRAESLGFSVNFIEKGTMITYQITPKNKIGFNK